MAGKVKYLMGFVFGKNDKPVLTQRDAWKQEADCGCGIDCCNKNLVLEDQSNGNTYELVFDNGVPKYRIKGSADEYTVIATV